jgi:hypothetical protein
MVENNRFTHIEKIRILNQMSECFLAGKGIGKKQNVSKQYITFLSMIK